jgi:hypothetical protein
MEVRLEGVRQTEARGRVLLKQGGRALTVNTLPGDAVLLAMAQGARIYAPPRLVKEAGISREDLDKARRNRGKQEPEEGVGGSGQGGVGGSGGRGVDGSGPGEVDTL